MDMFVRHMSIGRAAVGGVEILINRTWRLFFSSGINCTGAVFVCGTCCHSW